MKQKDWGHVERLERGITKIILCQTLIEKNRKEGYVRYAKTEH